MEASARVERVTPLELFFDLVFVFAITQVTTLLSADPTWGGLLRGLVVLAALWWAWAAYAWLTNTLNPEEGLVRIAMFVVMGAMLVCALAVPEAFGDHGVIFGVAYLVVRAMHLVLYSLAARGDPDLLGAVLRMTPSSTISGFLILGAGFLEGKERTTLWVLALAIDYLGVLVGRGQGWRLSPGHFAERHGLVVIIAIGESIVALGVSAAGTPLTDRGDHDRARRDDDRDRSLVDLLRLGRDPARIPATAGDGHSADDSRPRRVQLYPLRDGGRDRALRDEPEEGARRTTTPTWPRCPRPRCAPAWARTCSPMCSSATASRGRSAADARWRSRP